MKPRLFDFYCGQGGATAGYKRVGFEVWGCDIEPQPNYAGDRFILSDARALLADAAFMDTFDAFHASPPCQKFSPLGDDDNPDLLTPTLAVLKERSEPWVVENVPRAPFGNAYTTLLCGSAFGLRVRRHRLFASNVMFVVPQCNHLDQGQPLGVYGQLTNPIHSERPQRGVKAQGLAEASAAMGIDWMDAHGIVEAIPPAFTELLGSQLIAHLAVPA